MLTIGHYSYKEILGAGQTLRPCGVTTDQDLNIYVADSGFNQVEKFDCHGKWLMRFGQGEGSWFKKIGKLSSPTGVALDGQGVLHVADVSLDCISRYDAAGHFLGCIGRKGIDAGEFRRCRAVHFDERGFMWVVDAFNHRVQKFNPQGQFVLQFGAYGEGPGAPGKFNDPSDITFDSLGNLYVTDSKNNRVQIFDSEANFLRMFGETGGGDGQFIHPRGIVVDTSDHLYVVDTGNNRVQVFDLQGHFLYAFGGQQKWGGELNMPYGITINQAGNIIVTDNHNDRLMVFAAA